MTEITQQRKKQNIIIAFSILITLALVIICTLFIGPESWAYLSLAVVVLSLFLFFFSLERKKQSLPVLVLTAVLTALAVAGRMVFSPVAGFKPVAAIAILTGIFLGRRSGFVCGALSAFISNAFFGQGPWTPFQMLTYGMIGFTAGLLSVSLKKSKLLLSLYGALSGVCYSLIMDVWSTLWEGMGFEKERFFLKLYTSLPFLAIYALSNIVFLLIMIFPFESLFRRLKKKYGIGE